MDPSQRIDYKQLLEKYIKVIAYQEGLTYINRCSTKIDAKPVSFSESELIELTKIVRQIESVY